MYEFTKKEIRKKFKETDYGKKTNKWLYISMFITIIIYITALVFFYLFIKNIDDLNDIYYIMFPIIGALVLTSSITTCYFDGKRDGAIEQFKRDYKNE